MCARRGEKLSWAGPELRGAGEEAGSRRGGGAGLEGQWGEEGRMGGRGLRGEGPAAGAPVAACLPAHLFSFLSSDSRFWASGRRAVGTGTLQRGEGPCP